MLTGILAPLLLIVSAAALASPPELYRSAAYQSPVRGDPDDLLLFAGYGFAAGDSVVYRAVSDTSQLPPFPRSLPLQSDPDLGAAPVVSFKGAPYSLTVRLPAVMRKDQTYALWVRNAGGELSRAILINDARPLWITPAYVYVSRATASLPREIKLVGRNLHASAGAIVRVRFSGPRSYTAPVISDSSSNDIIDQYVARVRVPDGLPPGQYRVGLSRDGMNWSEVADQFLTVLADPPPAPEIDVSEVRFGACRPDDGIDDTACIVRALAAAQKAGGGAVVFGSGTWDLVDSTQTGVVGDEGIVVPAGVSLRGAGTKLTRLQRHAEWSARAPAAAVLTLTGRSTVTGFTFSDLQSYLPRDRAGPFLQLGEHFERVASDSGAPLVTASVDDVVITDNVFDKTMVAIGNGGLPITRLMVTYNVFGAFHAALELPGNRFDMANKFRIDDSIISRNVFDPGSKLDLLEKTGTVASELGAGHRVDFSRNVADGASTDYLNTPDDPRGWRAAFFWNMSNSVEQVLVSQNTATCTGDKIGDGEAISLDNNANTFGLFAVASVSTATHTSVAVGVPLVARQNGRDVPLASYYVDHWVQIVDGPGIGQARRIVGYSTDPLTHVTTIRVSPAWDVVPVSGRTRIGIGREFWQFYALDNMVDNRRPLCQKSNRSRQDAGVIALWAQSADTVIAGNRQFDSDGIFVQQVYSIPDHPCPDCTMQTWFQSALEIRSNLVDGEYAWDKDCSSSGIELGLGAASNAVNPPTISFGVSVSHNRIRHADGQYSGAIAQLGSWTSGPAPHRWPLGDSLLIHHNSIVDIDGPRARQLCGQARPRTGIAFPDDAIAWRTVLYANACSNVSKPIGSGGVDTTNVCPSSVPDSCECPEINASRHDE